jgi:hypothetical protein
MNMEDLLSRFNAHVEKYTQHREYIRRAQSQASKFSTAIIEKVVLDHEIKSGQVADQVLPLVPEIEGLIADILAEKDDIQRNKASSDERMEELDLRLAIGEIDEDGYDAEGGELRGELEAANGKIEVLDGDLQRLTVALDRWVTLAAEARQDDGRTPARPAPAPVAAPAPVVVPVVVAPPVAPVVVAAPPVAPVVVAPPPVVAPVVAPAPVAEPEVASVEDAGQHTHLTPVKEDVSAVFEDSPAATAAKAINEPVAAEAIEASEVDFDFDEPKSAEPEAAPVEEPAPAEMDVEINMDGAGVDAIAGDEIGVDLDVAEAVPAAPVAPAASGSDESRRAILLYQEGTADEQIYPFTNDVLTIGRGRDNDIQIKNDSKVSRFHCKFFKRGGHFYVEDNKSSNGTLVNGELITERRLFGGEEVIIGETFFRFRIL